MGVEEAMNYVRVLHVLHTTICPLYYPVAIRERVDINSLFESGDQEGF